MFLDGGGGRWQKNRVAKYVGGNIAGLGVEVGNTRVKIRYAQSRDFLSDEPFPILGIILTFRSRLFYRLQ